MCCFTADCVHFTLWTHALRRIAINPTHVRAQVTAAARTMVAKKFAESGITVYNEGSLNGVAIEKDKLIDNHYYAIANKASLTKPKDLNPPQPKQDDFEKKFGISWKAALAKGIVYNAVDGCKRLGIDGAKMDDTWGKAKKAGDLVKFGGGFYAGRIPATKKESDNSWISGLVLTLYALLGK